jgi:hypothetical protein
MRLTDIVNLVAEKGASRYAQKRAGIALPLAVGAMIPGIAGKAVERASTTERELENARQGKHAAWNGPSATHQAKRPTGGSGGMFDFRGFNPKSSPFGDAMSNMFNQAGQSAQGGLADSMKGLAASPLQGVAQGVSGGIGESIKRMMLGREFGERKDPLHMGAGAAIQTFGKEMGTSGANLLRDIANKAMEAVGHAGDASARQAILGDLKRNDSVLAGADDKILMEAYHTMTRFAPTLSTDKNAVRSFLRQAVMSGSGPDYMSIKLISETERAVTGGNGRD